MSDSVKVFVVEDEIIHQEAIKVAVAQCSFSIIGLSDNADKAFAGIDQIKPDIVLIDIALPGINNGITLAKQIHDKLKIPVIFTTSYAEESIIDQAAQSFPHGYLTKPVNYKDLKAAILLALSRTKPPEISTKINNSEITLIKVGDKLIRVNINDIILIRADGDNCIAVVTKNKELICRTTLKKFCEKLPANFIQTHRSWFINIDYLDLFNEKEQTVFLHGKSAPVARNFKASFFQNMKKW